MSNGDGMDEVVEQHTQMAAFALMRREEVRARRRERLMRQAEAEQQHGVRRLAERMRAERDSARAVYAAVQTERWWERAAAEDVAQAWSEAAEWSLVDEQARAAQSRIREQVRDRWGLDPDAVDLADAAALRRLREEQGQQSETREAEPKAEPGETRERDGQTFEEDVIERVASEEVKAAARAAEAAVLDDPEQGAAWRPTEADVWREAEHRFKDDSVKEHGTGRAEADELWSRANPTEKGSYLSTAMRDLNSLAKAISPYDSHERRDAFAVSLEGIVSPVVIESRIRADIAQGRPAPEATRGGGTPIKARPVRNQHERQRENQKSR